MRIRVYTPLKIMVDEKATRVCAEAENGSLCILPRHIDFVTSLSTGILLYSTEDGIEKYLAVDGGILVKRHNEVFVVSMNVVAGDDLDYLQKAIEEEILDRDEHEKRSRSVLAMLEGSILREINKHGQMSYE